MLGKERARKILEEAISYSTSEETEVHITGGKHWLTRFANNYIHQNVVQKDYSITARLIEGKKVGIASSNVFHDEYLKDAILKAQEVLRNQIDDPHIVPLSPPGEYKEIKNAYDAKTMEFTPRQSAEEVEHVIKKCKKNDLIAAGTLSLGDNVVTLMNSKGTFVYHAWTDVGFTLTTINSEGGTGYSDYYGTGIDEIDVENLTDIAIKKALLNKNQIELPPGEYPVILEEKAVASLILFLSSLGFGALSHQEGRSFMKADSKITGENITIIDDAYKKETLGLPFDFEGVPRQKVTLIENGIATGLVYDMKTAHKGNVVSTGHALPPPSTRGPFPLNLSLLPGNISKEDIIQNTDRAILVTRFWYDNVVDPKKTIVTGLTRDGIYLVEGGKITTAVKNMRYNNSVLEALSHVSYISNKLKSIKKYGLTIACPAIKIDKFKFSGLSA
ncbi:MAG TPA: TldD/PmbA family protein [Candidatus Eremiobacteraeota bacterium]|nr:MAG: protease TldD [bacterium ADurb.Bin363]HPZ08069.1 TldD/PmbA family protein [Candidatus Eremiobacteraeota bacterium]